MTESFQEILESLMNSKTEAAQPSKASEDTTWIQDLKKLGDISIQSGRRYPHQTPPTWVPTHLPSPLREAYEFFHSHGQTQITDQSSPLAYKKAFRQLAKQLHPDVHPQSEQFQRASDFRALQVHYAVLLGQSKAAS